MSFEMSALLLTWVVVALLALAMGGMLRHVRTLTQQVQGQAMRPRGPVIGSVFPSPASARGNGNGEVIVFLRSECHPCEALIPEIRRLSSAQFGPKVTAVFREDRPESDLGNAQVLEHQAPLFETVGVSTTPYAVVVGPQQTVIAARPIGSPSALVELLHSIEGSLENGRVIR